MSVCPFLHLEAESFCWLLIFQTHLIKEEVDAKGDVSQTTVDCVYHREEPHCEGHWDTWVIFSM